MSYTLTTSTPSEGCLYPKDNSSSCPARYQFPTRKQENGISDQGSPFGTWRRTVDTAHIYSVDGELKKRRFHKRAMARYI